MNECRVACVFGLTVYIYNACIIHTLLDAVRYIDLKYTLLYSRSIAHASCQILPTLNYENLSYSAPPTTHLCLLASATSTNHTNLFEQFNHN